MSIAPPPPPPPPLPSVLPITAVTVVRSVPQTPLLHKAGLPTTSDEVRRLCCQLRHDLCQPDGPWIYRCATVTPELQSGPQCGLVALQMAAQVYGDHTPVAKIVALAREKSFTNCGEMFSVVNMGCLWKDLWRRDVEVIDCNADKRFLSVVIGYLRQGTPVLVPYDADKNHSPCAKSGHKAHWAVLCGYLLTNSSLLDSKSVAAFQRDDELGNLYSVCDESDSLIEDDCQVGDVYVFARQGKSRHLALWPLYKLLESNGQLLELGSERSNDGNTYVLPVGGMEHGLCRKLLALK